MELQRLAGNRAVNSLLDAGSGVPPQLQRYVLMNRKSKGFPISNKKGLPTGHIALSANGGYFVFPNKNKLLWAHNGAAPPFFCEATGLTVENYTAYRPARKFLQDCLHTAEEVLHGAQTLGAGKQGLALGQVSSRVRGPSGWLQFGRGDKSNKAAAQKFALAQPGGHNEAANPQVGQAFVVVGTGDTRDGYPYHAAAVVALDGGDRMTIEVFASSNDARQEERASDGAFDIYSVGDAQGDSFHTQWAAMYDEPITIVLDPGGSPTMV